MPPSSSPEPDVPARRASNQAGLTIRTAAGALIAAIVLIVAVVVVVARGHGHNRGTRTAASGRATARPRARRHQATTFYVSDSGRDSYRGTTPTRPWRTVSRVDRAALGPGDRVLFHGGQRFADQPLMPGGGAEVSGAAGAAITFASYGGGRARLTRGVYLTANAAHPGGPHDLAFVNLILGPQGGLEATADGILVRHLLIAGLQRPLSEGEVGIETEGSHWRIEDNTIERTGDSGMLLGFRADRAGDPPGGYDYRVTGNVISRTGLDRSITYGTHGIYLKVAEARVAGNRISNFADDGISVRYRDASILDNTITGGSIGIAFFEYDRRAGTSRFTGNVIRGTSRAAIFVCGPTAGCEKPLESFVIEDNRVASAQGMLLNLSPSSGHYTVLGNSRDG